MSSCPIDPTDKEYQFKLIIWEYFNQNWKYFEKTVEDFVWLDMSKDKFATRRNYNNGILIKVEYEDKTVCFYASGKLSSFYFDNGSGRKDYYFRNGIIEDANYKVVSKVSPKKEESLVNMELFKKKYEYVGALTQAELDKDAFDLLTKHYSTAHINKLLERLQQETIHPFVSTADKEDVQKVVEYYADPDIIFTCENISILVTCFEKYFDLFEKFAAIVDDHYILKDFVETGLEYANADDNNALALRLYELYFANS